MKKKNVIIIALCVVVVALIIVVAFLLGRNSNKQELPTYNPANTKAVATQAATDVAEDSGDVSISDIQVVKKYVFLDEEDFNMVLVVENTGKGNAAVSVVGKVFDGANACIGTERESIFLDPGAQSVVAFDFDTEGVKVKNDDYKLTVAKSTTIKPGIKNIAESNHSDTVDDSLNSYHHVVHLLSHVRLFVTPWYAACQASLSFTIEQIG